MEYLTESEELVMKAVWDCGNGVTLSGVLEVVNSRYDKDWMPQTVSTFLTKLRYKKYLRMDHKGKIYSYTALVSEGAYKRKLYLEMIAFWFDGSVENLLLDMVQNGDLQLEDLRRIYEA